MLDTTAVQADLLDQADLLARLAVARTLHPRAELLPQPLQAVLLPQAPADLLILADAKLEPTTNAQLDHQGPRDLTAIPVWTVFQDWTEFQERTLRTSLQKPKMSPPATTAHKDPLDHQDRSANPEVADTRVLTAKPDCPDVMDSPDIQESKVPQAHQAAKDLKDIPERRELMDASRLGDQDQRDNVDRVENADQPEMLDTMEARVQPDQPDLKENPDPRDQSEFPAHRETKETVVVPERMPNIAHAHRNLALEAETEVATAAAQEAMVETEATASAPKQLELDSMRLSSLAVISCLLVSFSPKRIKPF